MALAEDSSAASRPSVLMGFANALAAPEAAWSLLDAGYRVTAFTRKRERPATAWCTGVELVEITAPEDDAGTSQTELASLVHELDPTAVLPLDDRAIWLSSRALDASPVTLVGMDAKKAEIAIDKTVQLEMASAAGFSCPPTSVLSSGTDEPGHVEFPVVVKPARAVEIVASRLRRGSNAVCAGPDELEAALGRWDGRSPVLLQPRIEGTNEGMFAIAGPEGVSNWFAHERIRMMNPAGSAASACRARPVDTSLLAPAERLVEAMNWRGPFMIELMRDRDGKPWFLEFNGRLWGSLALARRAGFEYPAWAVRQALDPGFSPPDHPAPEGTLVCRHLGAELAYLAFVARGPGSRALAPAWPTFGGALREVITVHRSDRWYNYRRDNRSVLLADTVGTLHSLARAYWRGRRHP